MFTNRPIPGESLTIEPKSIEYERPPQTVDVKEALPIHLDNLNRPEGMRDIVFFMQNDVPLKIMVEGLLRSAVLEGIHSVDISLMIAPVVHEYIKGELDALQIEYDEGIDDSSQQELLQDKRAFDMALEKFLEEEGDEPDVLSLEDTVVPPAPEKIEGLEDEGQEEEKPQGLMARRT